jgi:oligopeptide transport system substrate-binding protein
VVTREAKVHLTALREGNYDIGYVTTILDVFDATALLGELMSNAPGNYPHWSDRHYDEAMTAALNSPEVDQQHALLLQAETRLLEESPVAPLYFNARNWLMSPRVRGWQDDALWTRFYHNVEVIAN